MKTVEDFFNSSHSHPFHTDRSNKIEELRRPVYSKKIKQRKPKLSLPKTDFITTIYCTKNSNINNTKQSEQKKVKKSKSQLFFNKIKPTQEIFQQKNHLSNNLIIQKLEYKKQLNEERSSIKKNNFMKLFQRITQRISGTPQLKVKNFQQKSEEYTKKIPKMRNLKINSQNFSPIIGKKSIFSQNIKIVDIVKNQDIEQSLINHFGQLRKKRNSMGQIQQDKGQNNKLVPKNSLFFMNYLKQKEKKQQGIQSSHINFIKSAAQVIKIEENIDLKNILMNKENQKSIFRSKLSMEKLQKANKIFNSIKIQPW